MGRTGGVVVILRPAQDYNMHMHSFLNRPEFLDSSIWNVRKLKRNTGKYQQAKERAR